jgi:hypothetical protein
MIIGKAVVKVAVMDDDMANFAVDKANEALLTMFHEQVSSSPGDFFSKLQPT